MADEQNKSGASQDSPDDGVEQAEAAVRAAELNLQDADRLRNRAARAHSEAIAAFDEARFQRESQPTTANEYRWEEARKRLGVQEAEHEAATAQVRTSKLALNQARAALEAKRKRAEAKGDKQPMPADEKEKQVGATGFDKIPFGAQERLNAELALKGEIKRATVYRNTMGAVAFGAGIVIVFGVGIFALCSLHLMWTRGLTILSADKQQFPLADELMTFVGYTFLAKAVVSAALIGFGYFLMRVANMLTRHEPVEAQPTDSLSMIPDDVGKALMAVIEWVVKLAKKSAQPTPRATDERTLGADHGRRHSALVVVHFQHFELFFVPEPVPLVWVEADTGDSFLWWSREASRTHAILS